MAEKLIPYNPAKSCTLPKGEHMEMKTLPLDKIAAFFAEGREIPAARGGYRESLSLEEIQRITKRFKRVSRQYF